MTADPTGLFQRIPELEPLCQDPRIRKAVEGGDPFKVYRALWWARTLNRLPQQRDVLKLLLSQRRLFAIPIKKAPTLHTINTIGFTIVGSSEKNADGTYIATHSFVILQILPLFPLGAYVVGPGQKARSYSFFARVPLSSLYWGWSRFWALAVVIAVGVGAVRAGYSVGHHELHIVNAFDKPVQVQIGQQSATVPAHGRLPLTLPVGKYRGKALVAGTAAPIDETDLDIVSNNSLLIWNLAGAAPVYVEPVIYSTDSAGKHAEIKPTIYCGQRYLPMPHIDDEFSEPPKEVQMSEGEHEVRRTHVDVIGAGKNGAGPSKITSAVCFGWLASQGKLPQALEVQTAAARVDGWEAGIASNVLAIQAAADPAVAAKLALEAAAAQPKDVDVQRSAQQARISAGQEAAVIAEAKQRAAANPDSELDQYLYARLLEGPEGLAAAEKLLKRFPKNVQLLRLAVYERAAAGNWADSDRAWQTLQEAKPEEAIGELEFDALDLVALGKAKDAEARVEKTFPSLEKGSNERRDVAELHTRLALLSGESNPDRLLQQTEDDDSQATLARARLGLPLRPAKEPQKTEEPLVQLVKAARKNPTEAIAASAKLEVLDLFSLDPASWALTFGEAARTGVEDAQKSLSRYFPGDSRSKIDLLRRFVRGDAVTLPVGWVEPTVRAAALFVRSRNSSLAPKERAALVAQARHLDWLHTSISSAIDSWPQPIAAR
jgi:hypothetical protein